MPEVTQEQEQIQQTQQVHQEAAKPQVAPKQQPATDDILSRVTKFVEEGTTEGKTDEQIDAEVFNDIELRKKIDAIQDPQIKADMIALRKSAMRGVNDKFQEMAEIRKELQALKEQGGNSTWTPDKIQALLNRPDFVNAVQQLTGNGQTEDPLEFADEGLKKYVKGLESKLSQIENQTKTVFDQQNQALRQQQHESLKSKYGNYDPKKIDEITYEMLEGKIQATNEHIYKAFYHDENVRRAYELGRKDERDGVSEKIQSSSFSGGVSTQKSDGEMKPENGESNQSFWNRIAMKNLQKAAQAKK